MFLSLLFAQIDRKEYFAQKKLKAKERKTAAKRAREEATQQQQQQVKPKDERVEGLILEVTNVPQDSNRDAFNDIFGKYGKVRYVDFTQKEEGKLYIRFTEPSSATVALDAITKGELKIGDAAIAGRILQGSPLTFHFPLLSTHFLCSGEEDESYWAQKVTPFLDKKPGKKRRF